MHWEREHETGELLPHRESVGMATGVDLDFSSLPPELIRGVLERARSFEANPFTGSRRGKKKPSRRADDTTLLIAYQAAKWKLGGAARGNRAKAHAGGEALTELAHKMVGKHYNLSPETVRSALQDARRSVPPAARKTIALLDGEGAWRLTLAHRGGN